MMVHPQIPSATLFARVANAFLALDTPENAAPLALGLLGRELALDACAVYLSVEDDSTLVLGSWAGLDAASVEAMRSIRFEPAAVQALVAGAAGLLNPWTQAINQISLAMADSGITASACQPLRAGARVVGAFFFGSRTRTRFDAQELARLSEAAQVAAIALDRALLLQRQRRLLSEMQSAQENRRRQLSRELHDEIGQHLTALQLGLSALEQQAPSEWRERISHLRGLTQRASRDAHHLALELRPAALDDAPIGGVLRSYAEGWGARYGIDVDFQAAWRPETATTPALDVTLYRVLQEALNNIVKHARASRVTVLLVDEEDRIRLVVEDNGVGFDVAAASAGDAPTLGLTGMRERLALQGGALLIESAPGRGTSVFATLPVASGSFRAGRGRLRVGARV